MRGPERPVSSLLSLNFHVQWGRKTELPERVQHAPQDFHVVAVRGAFVQQDDGAGPQIGDDARQERFGLKPPLHASSLKSPLFGQKLPYNLIN